MSKTEQKPWQDEDWLRTKCIDEGLSTGDIASEHDITTAGVRYWMEKFDIPRRSFTRITLSPEEMRELYWEDEMSTVQIADHLGCSQMGVNNFLIRHDIERRDATSRVSLGRGGDGTGVTYAMDKNGQMYWGVNEDGTNKRVSIHRLIAVAEYGLNAVKDKHIHHVNHCGWDNRVGNLEVLGESEHLSYHAEIRAGNGVVPWEKHEGYDGFSKEELTD